jgi:hypothetical protein
MFDFPGFFASTASGKSSGSMNSFSPTHIFEHLSGEKPELIDGWLRWVSPEMVYSLGNYSRHFSQSARDSLKSFCALYVDPHLILSSLRLERNYIKKSKGYKNKSNASSSWKSRISSPKSEARRH